MLAERLDVALALHHEYDWRFEHLPQAVQNLPRTLPPNPSVAAIGMPLFEVLRVVAYDLIKEASMLIGVVVGRGDYALRSLPVLRLQIVLWP